MRMQLRRSNITVETRSRFIEQLLPRVEAIAGFRTPRSPCRAAARSRGMARHRRRYARDRRRSTAVCLDGVDLARYFATLVWAVIRGRGIEAADSAPGSANVVINQLMPTVSFPATIRSAASSFRAAWRRPGVRSRGTIVGTRPKVPARQRQRWFHNAVVYRLLHAPDRVSSLIVRSALPRERDGRGRGAVQAIDTISRSSPSRPSNMCLRTSGRSSASLRRSSRLMATIGLMLSAVGRLRADRLRGHPAHAGNRRAHGRSARGDGM